MSAALALLADTSLMMLGGSLKRRERISARLGDILSQLISHPLFSNIITTITNLLLTLIMFAGGLQQCLQKIQIACDELFDNFPNRWVGKLLSWIIFPFGISYRTAKR